MTDTGIIYVIAAGCTIFGIITAYLIYNFVQQEKAQYYKYMLQRKQMKKDPVDYNYVAPKEKKRKLSGPVVAAADEPKKPESRAAVPVPAPILAPVHLPPVPTAVATPPAPVEPVPEPSPPQSNGNHVDDTPIPTTVAAAAVGGAVEAGAFATYEVARTNSEPEPSQQQPKNKKDKKKRKGSIKKVAEEDFDDYRNFSPPVLPPPKGVPPPRANYTGTGGNAPPQSDDVQSVVVETGGRSRGVDFPQVSVVSRNGLEF